MVCEKQSPIHPTIRKCLQHLDIIDADDKVKQVVYMYMETLLREKNLEISQSMPHEASFHLKTN